ncbi:unnamed protein product [Rotaria sp. Silwood1]|nr:unnamed protein product [Rotaria sp. Silwood1]CAF1481479.1 unnamed protein product [Rotaria sp. Silwood1]CAF3551186.1 unnamed protein product [Rotaria sp. Silwood1]CAF3584005.1 unnamed protein product [Rotaria sp. Silwood1]CAF4846937.1 unnamed protein product [Rotaria sp. Silwood1]
MYGGNPYVLRELASDMWIERNVPGGLNSRWGSYLDNMMGGNPNPTFAQRFGGYGGYGGYPGYGSGYGYSYGRWY